MSPAAPLRPGQLLAGRWRVGEVLGAGSMATVHRGVNVASGVEVAVKVLDLELARDAASRERFLREGATVKRVAHRGVARTLAEGVDGETVYLVMELLVGRSLKEEWTARGRRMPAEDVIPIVEGILEVLEVAHAAGVVHRDLKPDNVFLTKDGVALVDFGIARLREEQAFARVATVNGKVLGTPAFMPPEQALAEWDRVDGRSDLYAVGATAFTLLSGQFVHVASSLPELLMLTAMQPARSIRTVAPDIPHHLGEVIDRALAFAPADRWPDARAMLDALRGERPSAVQTLALSSTAVLPVPSDLLELPAATTVIQVSEATLAPFAAREPRGRSEALTRRLPDEVRQVIEADTFPTVAMPNPLLDFNASWPGTAIEERTVALRVDRPSAREPVATARVRLRDVQIVAALVGLATIACFLLLWLLLG